MKKSVLLAVLVSLLFPALAFARDSGKRGEMEEQEKMIKQKEMEHRVRMLDLEYRAKEAELERHIQNMQHHHKDGGGGPAGLFLLIFFVVNILVTVWVFTDIRARNHGSGIWIVVTLLTGLFGALIYTLARLGDVKAAEEEAEE